MEKPCEWEFCEGKRVPDFDGLPVKMLDFGRDLPVSVSGRRRAEVIWRTSLMNEDQEGAVPSDHTELHFWSFFAWNAARLAAEFATTQGVITGSTTAVSRTILSEFELPPDTQRRDVEERIQRYASHLRREEAVRVVTRHLPRNLLSPF